ncbi:MAG TPA: HlyD family efflux transporter periplasmic adaptor subunit [Xanthomonadaceae bacterium]|nr:HlyD family efflux transporter periplasmic adaptor subunit [Xanthomonadaceae bacterium]
MSYRQTRPNTAAIVMRIFAMAFVVACAGCAPSKPQVLGTLEWDRITLPAPVSERIADVPAREGQMVATNDTVLVLESVRTRARLDEAQADVRRLQKALDELRVGPRQEDIDQARAKLAGAQSVATNAHRAFERAQAEFVKQVIAHSELDSAKAQAGSADADVDAAQAALATLLHGTRPQDIAQAEASVASAQAQVDSITVDLQRVRISAPRAGRIDSIPYKLGDQPPIGAPLAIELVGDAPYARVYVPEPMRAGIHVGESARVYVGDGKRSVTGRVRLVRSEPSFTPYYALNGDDVSRMSYIAEIELGKDAADLPPGLPVRVEFAGGATK